MPKANKYEDYIHGSLEDQMDPDIKGHIETLFKKITKTHEFELMFFNYKQTENPMGFENFLKILEYINYRNKRDPKMKMENTVSLDVIYQTQHDSGKVRDTIRVSIDGNKNI